MLQALFGLHFGHGRRRWGGSGNALGKSLEETLKEREEHVHRIPNQKRESEWRDRGSLRNGEVIKQPNNGAPDAGDEEAG